MRTRRPSVRVLTLCWHCVVPVFIPLRKSSGMWLLSSKTSFGGAVGKGGGSDRDEVKMPARQVMIAFGWSSTFSWEFPQLPRYHQWVGGSGVRRVIRPIMSFDEVGAQVTRSKSSEILYVPSIDVESKLEVKLFAAIEFIGRVLEISNVHLCGFVAYCASVSC